MSEMIDKDFWYKYAKDRIVSAIIGRDAAASKLDTLLGVYWGIYTSSLVLGVFTGVIKVDEWWKLLIMYLPSVSLLIARWFATYAQLPIEDVAFNPIIVDDIINSCYVKTLTSKKKRLYWANLLTVISTLLLAVSILVSKFDFSPSHLLRATVNKDGVEIRGKAYSDQELLVTVSGDNDSIRPLIILNRLSLSFSMKAKNNGEFDTLIQKKQISNNITCVVSWKKDQLRNESMTTIVK